MMKRKYQENSIQKKAMEGCITSDETDLKPKSVISDRKDICHQKDVTFSKSNTMNKTASRNWKQKLIGLLGETDLAANHERDFYTRLSVTGRESRKQSRERKTIQIIRIRTEWNF